MSVQPQAVYFAGASPEFSEIVADGFDTTIGIAYGGFLAALPTWTVTERIGVYTKSGANVTWSEIDPGQYTFLHRLDVHSGEDLEDWVDSPLVLSQSGAPAYSAERWIKFTLAPEAREQTDVRFMIEEALPEGVGLFWGQSEWLATSEDSGTDKVATGGPKTHGKSQIATDTFPATDPMTIHLYGDDGRDTVTPGGDTMWLVLQGKLTGQAPQGPIVVNLGLVSSEIGG